MSKRQLSLGALTVMELAPDQMVTCAAYRNAGLLANDAGSWLGLVGTNGGTKMNPPGPVSAVNSRLEPHLMRARPRFT